MPMFSPTPMKWLSVLPALALPVLLALQGPPQPVITASTPQDPDDGLAARFAFDGDMTTRWSSSHEDNQWLSIDLGEPRSITGVCIHWETAYGRDYDIELSDDGTVWERVASVREGDGGFDEIYFGMRSARHVRMNGILRGTGWGFSIWEMQILGPEYERAFSSSLGPDADASAVMDGSPDTIIEFHEPGWIEVTLPEATRFGGVQLSWHGDQRSAWRLLGRMDAADGWSLITTSPGSFEAVEEVYFTQATAMQLRLELLAGGATLGEFTLKGPDETWNPARHFEMISRRAPDGAFPRWLRREQGYWTIIGEPQASHVSLLDEDGRIEVRKDGVSITPVLLIGDRLVTAKDAAVTQSLADRWAPMPSVEWTCDEVTLQIQVHSGGDGLTEARYRLDNTGEEEVALLLAVRPLQINPPWQRGGFSPIHNGAITPDRSIILINGERMLMVHPAATHAGTVGRSEQDIIEHLIAGEQLPLQSADAHGLVSAGLLFELGSKSAADFHLRIRMTDDAADTWADDVALAFDERHDAELKRWRELTGDWSIETTDPRLANLVRSNLAYLLINMDGPAIQPGTRNYEHSWIRDGSISATAMALFGVEQPVRAYVRWFSSLVREDGFVPFILRARDGQMPEWTADWAEYDSFGQFAYLVREYFELTGDRETLDMAWPKVKAALDRASALRRQRLGPEWEGTEFEGILPPSNSHEGYFPAQHSYWDDFTLLRGYQDGERLAQLVGDEQSAQRFAREGSLLRSALSQSIERVRQRDALETIPASADLGDFDSTSTSIGLMFADERDTLDPDALRATYDLYLSNVRRRHFGGEGSTYTAYEARTVGALLRMGRNGEAIWLLDTLLDDATRPAGWNHMGEVTHPDYRMPSYIGDMPHTWIGSGVIHAIRDLFVYEDRGALVLGAGIADDWWQDGVRVSGLRTWWGPVAYEALLVDGERVIRLQTPVSPPAGFRTGEGVRLDFPDF
jgi:hypothetical protein